MIRIRLSACIDRHSHLRTIHGAVPQSNQRATGAKGPAERGQLGVLSGQAASIKTATSRPVSNVRREYRAQASTGPILPAAHPSLLDSPNSSVARLLTLRPSDGACKAQNAQMSHHHHNLRRWTTAATPPSRKALRTKSSGAA